MRRLDAVRSSKETAKTAKRSGANTGRVRGIGGQVCAGNLKLINSESRSKFVRSTEIISPASLLNNNDNSYVSNPTTTTHKSKCPSQSGIASSRPRRSRSLARNLCDVYTPTFSKPQPNIDLSGCSRSRTCAVLSSRKSAATSPTVECSWARPS